jgi:hypothetical protein
MTHFTRRKVVQALGATATLGPFAIGSSYGQAHQGDVVIGAAQPITGVFAFAGVAMNNGLNDFVQWKNAHGGVAGHKLRYVVEDSGFKVDQSAAIFKKIMASEKPTFFYGDGTQWVKAVAQDAIASNHVMTSSTSLATAVADRSDAAALRAEPDLSAAARDPDGVHRARPRRGDQAEDRLRLRRHRVRPRRHPGRQGARREARAADRRRDRHQAVRRRRHAPRSRSCAAPSPTSSSSRATSSRRCRSSCARCARPA